MGVTLVFIPLIRLGEIFRVTPLGLRKWNGESSTFNQELIRRDDRKEVKPSFILCGCNETFSSRNVVTDQGPESFGK